VTELSRVNDGTAMFGHLCGADPSVADEDLMSIVGSVTASHPQSDDR
jgi:hypothetical protein